jgi:hypothetical protein
MIIKNVVFTSGQLNSAVSIAQTIPLVSGVGTDYGSSLIYRPNQVKFANTTGGAVHFAIFTNDEYTKFQSGLMTSNLIPVANNTTETITGILRNITTVYASGTSGHSSSATFVIYEY